LGEGGWKYTIAIKTERDMTTDADYCILGGIQLVSIADD
jgi:hypothetical protein